MTGSFKSRLKNKTQGRKLLCFSIALIALMGSTSVYAQSSSELNSRLSRLENEIETLNRAVYKGEAPPANFGASESSSQTADLLLRVQRLETELRTLTGKVEQQAYDAQQLQIRLDSLAQDSQMRLDTIERQLRDLPAPHAAATPPSNAAPSVPPQGTSPIISGSQPQQTELPDVLQAPAQAAGDTLPPVADPAATLDAATLYEQGFAQIKAQDFAAAEKSFDAFLKSYPDHALAPNALYWLGETFYVRKDFAKAARVFAQAYQKYPGGPKAADNLLKLGMSLAGGGQKAEACVALAELRKKYPNGPAPVLARGDQEMKTLSCPAG